jgi:integrase
MRFHDLRHSCASLLLAQHVPPRVVMETLGHSRISVTLGTYTHVMPALQRDAADAMDRALGDDLDGNRQSGCARGTAATWESGTPR